MDINAKEKRVAVMGTKEAVAEAVEWIGERAVEREVPLSEGQLHFLVQNKGARIHTLQAASGVGMVDLDKEAGMATLLGSAETVAKAVSWMEEELTEQSVTLNTRQMSWLTGGLGASSNNYTKSELRQMQQDTGLEYIHMAPERRCVVLVGTRSAVAAGVEWLEARRNMTVELYHIPKDQPNSNPKPLPP